MTNGSRNPISAKGIQAAGQNKATSWGSRGTGAQQPTGTKAPPRKRRAPWR